MTCPACQYPRSLVVNTRSGQRRRECRQCGVRWNTLEILGPGRIQPRKLISKKQKTEPESWLQRIEEKLNS